MMDGDDGFRQDCISLDKFRASETGSMVHSKLRSLYGYWDELRAGRITPMRADIDPRRMPCDVRHIFILEDIGNNNIRFRVAGSGIVEAFGMELRGMSARSIMAPECRESFSALIEEALEDPGVGYARLGVPRTENTQWEISLLPLRSDFGAVDRLMGCLHPLCGTGGRRQGPLQFHIDHMSVDSIAPTVLDHTRSPELAGFAEPSASFAHGPSAADQRKSHLKSIQGGLDTKEKSGPKTAGHLRIVEDKPS